MEKLKILCLVLIFSLCGIGLGTWSIQTKNLPIFQTVSTTTQTLVSRVFAPAPPRRLTIPAIGVDAMVEPVTVDSEHRMAVPKNIYNAGWYSLGVAPGQKGNAVIDGHYNTPTGAPNVFYYLDQLQPGDSIQVTDSQNHAFMYTVTQVHDYPYNQIPESNIFGPANQARLILITCSGVWDHASHNYSDRTVVFAELNK